MNVNGQRGDAGTQIEIKAHPEYENTRAQVLQEYGDSYIDRCRALSESLESFRDAQDIFEAAKREAEQRHKRMELLRLRVRIAEEMVLEAMTGKKS